MSHNYNKEIQQDKSKLEFTYQVSLTSSGIVQYGRTEFFAKIGRLKIATGDMTLVKIRAMNYLNDARYALDMLPITIDNIIFTVI